MKINKNLLLSLLFSLSIFVGALHYLNHAHQSGETCLVCTIQNHTDSADITPEFAEITHLSYFDLITNTPTHFISSSYTPTLFGRAPPTFS